MKRLLRSRYAGLFAAFLLLLAIAAFFTWLTPRLPPAPRAVVRLEHPYNRVVFSPDGRYVATAAWRGKWEGNEERVDLLDLKAGTHTLLTREDFHRIEFSPDSSRLVGTRYRNGLTIWDVKTGGAVVHVPDGGSRSRLSPDWRFLFVDEEGREDEPEHINILDLETQQRSRIEGRLGYDTHLIQFAPDSKRFALVRDKYDHILSVQLWELTPDFGPRLLHEREFVADSWAIAPDLMTAATVVTYSWPSERSWVQLWDLDTGVEKAHYLDSNGEATIDGLLFSRKGNYLVGMYHRKDEKSDVTPLILDANAGLEEVRLVAADSQLSPCERWAVCHDDSGAEVWDVQRRQKKFSLWSAADMNMPKGSNGYSFSDDGRYLLVTGLTGTQTNWSAVFASGRWGTVDTTETYPVRRLWDVERGEEIASFDDYSCERLSPDGTTIATLDKDRVRFWDVPPARPYGFTFSLIVLTWGLTLLVVWVVKRRFRRRRDASQGGKTREPAA
jgi:WD40 repeat protein